MRLLEWFEHSMPAADEGLFLCYTTNDHLYRCAIYFHMRHNFSVCCVPVFYECTVLYDNWYQLTLSAPNFRLYLSSALFCSNRLSIGKKFICKVKLNVRQRRSWWDGSLWGFSFGSMLFAKAYYYCLWQWKSFDEIIITVLSTSVGKACLAWYLF